MYFGTEITPNISTSIVAVDAKEPFSLGASEEEEEEGSDAGEEEEERK